VAWRLLIGPATLDLACARPRAARAASLPTPGGQDVSFAHSFELDGSASHAAADGNRQYVWRRCRRTSFDKESEMAEFAINTDNRPSNRRSKSGERRQALPLGAIGSA